MMNESLRKSANRQIGKSAAAEIMGKSKVTLDPHQTTCPTSPPNHHSSGAAVERRKDLLARPAPPKPGAVLSEILGPTNVGGFLCHIFRGHYTYKIQTNALL